MLNRLFKQAMRATRVNLSLFLSLSLSLSLSLFFHTCSSLAVNFCRLIWVRHSSHKSSATHSMVWLPAFGIFNVSTDVDACDCTRGLYGHRKRVCTGSSGRKEDKNPNTPGTRTRVSIAPGSSVGRSTN